MEPISDHGLQLIDLGVDFPKGGKPEDPEKNRGTRRKTGESGGKPGTRRKTGEPGEKPSKHGREQLQQLYSHEFQVLRINRG